MALPTEMAREIRTWAREHGISVNPQGFPGRELEDMYMVFKAGWGIPADRLRSFVQECRAWLNLHEVTYRDRDRLIPTDVMLYVQHLTSQSDDAKEMIRKVLEANPAIKFDIPIPVVEFDPEDEENENDPEDEESTPLDRIMKASSTQSITLVRTILTEVGGMLEGIEETHPVQAEGTARDAVEILNLAGGELGSLSVTYHLLHCNGECGKHPSRR